MDQILVDGTAPGARRITLNRSGRLNAFAFDRYVVLREAQETLRYDVAQPVIRNP